MLLQEALEELKRRETLTGVYRTRLAANILCEVSRANHLAASITGQLMLKTA